ncbi:MAG: hypothetical protein KKA07_07675 [Bacteroidetes bacterium]|nr:hypothetical protein [Bacteroidota bacterium]MBU1718941.1 hypothetical protein [Bacteroidota bacterium]
MDNNLYAHIAKRVKELGYTDFHVEPVRIVTKATKRIYFFPAYNELIFPISDIPEGTKIYSDTCIIDVGTHTAELIRDLSELTGMIIIELPVALEHLFEFIRVILQ